MTQSSTIFDYVAAVAARINNLVNAAEPKLRAQKEMREREREDGKMMNLAENSSIKNK